MRISLSAACVAVLLACCPLIASRAGGFQVSPTIVRVASTDKVATFELSNRGNEPVTVQSDAYAWSQVEGADRTEPATHVLVAPRLVTIPAGGSQLVRIAPRTGGAGAEQAYRVRFREVPAPAPEGHAGLRTLIAHDVPVFFVVDGKADVAWRAALDDAGNLVVSADNRGTRHLRFTGLEVSATGDRRVVEARGPRYVLARSAMRWPVATNTGLVRGDRVALRITHEQGTQNVSLVLE